VSKRGEIEVEVEKRAISGKSDEERKMFKNTTYGRHALGAKEYQMM
jgi:hypothetical protein